MKTIICILSAGVKRIAKGSWVNTGWADEDFDFGSPGGKMRIIAASSLVQKNNDGYIFVPGGRGHDVVNDEPERPDLSDIVKSELLEFGVPEDRIITEHNSNNTFEQLCALAEFMQKNANPEVVIVTNK